MKLPLNQSHLLYLSDTPLDLPGLVQQEIGLVTTLPGRKKHWFKALNNLRLNWQIRNLHATKPIHAIIINHPQFLSDGLRSFADKHNVPLIADTLSHPFNLNVVTRSQYQGFILSSNLIDGSQAATPAEAHTAVVPVALAGAKYWKLAGYRSQILNLLLIALNPDPTEQSKITIALDIVKSLNPNLTVDVVSVSDENPEPLLSRLKKAHLIINVSRDPVWVETTAAAVAAGIPVVTPKRPIHQLINPKHFPGYIIADWQVDTLSTVIQNSIYHPEETYRLSKNAQSWLKHNLGKVFLPITWLNGLKQLIETY